MNPTTSVVRGSTIDPTIMGKFIFPVLVVITTNSYKVYDSVFNASKVCDFKISVWLMASKLTVKFSPCFLSNKASQVQIVKIT
jgi:hypothetical protein